MRVKSGDAVIVGGEEFKIEETSAEAINTWLECFELGIGDEGSVEIPLLVKDGQGYRCFRPSKIKEALLKE